MPGITLHQPIHDPLGGSGVEAAVLTIGKKILVARGLNQSSVMAIALSKTYPLFLAEGCSLVRE